MTAEAAQVILAVGGARKVRVILPRSMTFQAALVHRLRRGALEAKDLRLVPATLDVVLARTMTSFASLLGGTATLVQRGFPVRGFIKVVVDIIMASLAGLRASILCRRTPPSGPLLPVHKNRKKSKN